jgi:uncharacterized RDD family membrane protein YckC
MVAQATPAAGVSRHGGIATRTIANVTVFLLGAMRALIGSLAGGWHIGTAERVLAACGWAFIVGTYFVLCWSTTSQTPGMRAMGVRVIDLRGGHLGVVRSTIRLTGLVLAIIPLGAGSSRCRSTIDDDVAPVPA